MFCSFFSRSLRSQTKPCFNVKNHSYETNQIGKKQRQQKIKKNENENEKNNYLVDKSLSSKPNDFWFKRLYVSFQHYIRTIFSEHSPNNLSIYSMLDIFMLNFFQFNSLGKFSLQTLLLLFSNLQTCILVTCVLFRVC